MLTYLKKPIALLSAIIMLSSTLTACNRDEDEVEELEIPVTITSTETGLPSNHEEIMSMIQEIQDRDGTGVIQVMSEYNVNYTDRYAYNQLTDAEKELYADILNAANSLAITVEIDDTVTTEMWMRVYGCVCMQEPELFWLSSAKASIGQMYYWVVDQDIIAERQAEIDNTVSDILSAVDGKTEYETLKYFHDYIVLNNTFSYVDAITEGAEKQTIYGGLVTGSVQCEGYAKTMMYLCDMAGIESVIVPGTSETGTSHAWNCVKIGDDWYNLDTTWDDPILADTDETHLRYNYFLVPDEWIHNLSHFNICRKTEGTQLTYFTPPACVSDEYNYFNVENLLFDDIDSAETALQTAMTNAVDNKTRVAEIRVSSRELYNAMYAKLSEYADWIKAYDSSVTKVTSNCDENLLIIELGIFYE